MTNGTGAAGLTIEMVDAMQDEMSKIGDTGDADAAKAAEDATKLAEVKAAEEAAKAKADAEVTEKKATDDKAKGGDDIDVVRELKEQIRASNEALRKATGDYQKLHKILVDKGLITEEEVAISKAEEEAARIAFTERQNKLIEMVSIMEVNPSYKDVREVCSQGNIDDVVDAFARFYIKENGGDLTETATRMEQEIWAEPNPYKKIYELVKKYHPRYKTVEETDEQKKTREAEEAAKKIAEDADKTEKEKKAAEKKAIDAQASAANMGAGGTGGSGGTGWTAAKIDALAEDELKTVPKDIYEKYLRGTLT